MKISYQFIFLLLGTSSTYIAALQNNGTDNSMSGHDAITAATLLQMTEEFNNEYGNKEATLSVSKAALNYQKGNLEDSMIVETLDDSDRETDSDDGSSVKKESVQVVDKLDNEMNNQEQNQIEVEDDDDNSIDVDSAMISDIDSDSRYNVINSNFEIDESNTSIVKDTEDDMEILHSNFDTTNDDINDTRDNADRIKEREDKETVDRFLGIRAMPDNATFFELFKAQIQADFAPFLILIPKPIKKLISKNAKILGKKIQIAVQGPLTPFVIVTSKLLKLLGNGIIYIGDDIVKLSSFLSTFDDSELRQKLRLESKQMGSQIMLNDECLQSNEEEVVNIIDIDDRELVDNIEDRDIIDNNSDSDSVSYSGLIEGDSMPKDSSNDELHSVIEDNTNIRREQNFRDNRDDDGVERSADEWLAEVVGEGDSTEGIKTVNIENVKNSQSFNEDEVIDYTENLTGDGSDGRDDIEGEDVEEIEL